MIGRNAFSRWGAGAVLAAVLVFCAAGAAGCKHEAPPLFDTAGAPQRAEQALVEFRRFGEGRFEIVTFKAGTESTRVLEDDFHARSLLYRVPIEARVRYLKDFDIDREDALQRSIGAPGWTPDHHREMTMLGMVLGADRKIGGTVQDVRAAVVFEDLEPGVRFRAVEDDR
jgi:hypothetical protein